jgi:3-oxoacyl-[acyl-carrier-protein] synthase III
MRIKAISSAVPKTKLSAADVADLVGASAEFIEQKVGSSTRYVLGPDETGVALATQACHRLFERESMNGSGIGLLVCVTQTPDYRIPHNSALLQHALELPTSCAAFDINLGCSGYVYALSVCKGLMAAQNIASALLVTVDPYSKIMDIHDKNTMAVFGDAATATLMGNDSGAEIGNANLGTDGSQSMDLTVKAGGAAQPLFSIAHEQPVQFTKEDAALHMYGRGIFNFVMKNVPGSIAACLEQNGETLESIDYFALHQGSRYMLEALAKNVGIPAEKMCYNIERYGNTVSSTVPMLLEDLRDQGKALPGTKVLVSGFGVGLSWATNIVYF